MTTKTCTGCNVTKPIDQFSLARNGIRQQKPVRKSKCKPCQAEQARTWYNDNKDRANENKRRWNLQKLYGITIEEYDAMLEAQNGVCLVCQEEDKDTNLAVDHCHSTGRVRGLLCNNCNRAIGLLKDNPAVIKRAAAYLERSD